MILKQIWQGRLGGLRLAMILAVATLIGIGMVSIYLTRDAKEDYFQKQMVWVAVGIAGFVAVNLFPYRALGGASYGLFFLSLVLLGVLLIGRYVNLPAVRPFLPVINGAWRWIRPLGDHTPVGLDIKIQPSEIAKLAYILALAWYLRNRENYRTLKGLIGPFALTLLPMVLIEREPDLGTVLLFPPVLLALLFVAGARLRHLLAVLVLGLLATPLMYLKMEDYQKTRIQVLLNQNTDDPYWLKGYGYQLHLSKIYIGSGGTAGQGWQRSAFASSTHLPEGHNDFIFALIAHQWGFAGGLAVLLLYALVIGGGIEIASQQVDAFGHLLAVGITALLAAQVFVNVGMTMGLMPVTGMNLPFVSYGGSSMLCNFLALGLLVNVARHRPHTLARKAAEYKERI